MEKTLDSAIITKDKIWQSLCAYFEHALSASAFQTFMSSANPQHYEANILTLVVPNTFSKQWIKEKCEPVLAEDKTPPALQHLMLAYQIEDVPNSSDEQLSIFTPPEDIAAEASSTSPFNANYSFDHFIVGHNNRFAHAASEAVAKAPAKAYNPFFIYGSVGLGKTHLLHAMGIEIANKYPHLKIKLVSSEKFTNDLINAIKDKKVDAFRAKYRMVDILLVDDIQFLAGKEQTQEEFFHTFNDLYSNNKQIIITSDRPPKDIPTLEIRLRTRFEWGLIADIQPPEFETRIAILRKKIEMNGYQVSNEILHFIATQIPSNVREMEGALTRVVAYASLLNTEVTLSLASNVIRDFVGIRQEKPLSIQHIKRKVCDYFNISNNDIISKNRSKELVYARQIAMYLARELTHVSLPKIGENFGNRDHSTVMHACDKIKTLLNQDIETQNVVNILVGNIKQDQ